MKDGKYTRSHKVRMSFTLDRLCWALDRLAHVEDWRDRHFPERIAALRRTIDRYTNRLAVLLEGSFCRDCQNYALYCECFKGLDHE